MLKPNNLYLLVLTITLVFSPIFLLKEKEVMADDVLIIIENITEKEILNLSISQQTTLLSLNSIPSLKESDISKRIRVIVTGYSSSVWETQGDPFITASGNRVRDGIVANNLLSFGTKVRLPEIFEDKIFIVEDRMNSRKGHYHIDIWFPSRELALNFGSKLTEMEILTKTN